MSLIIYNNQTYLNTSPLLPLEHPKQLKFNLNTNENALLNIKIENSFSSLGLISQSQNLLRSKTLLTRPNKIKPSATYTDVLTEAGYLKLKNHKLKFNVSKENKNNNKQIIQAFEALETQKGNISLKKRHAIKAAFNIAMGQNMTAKEEKFLQDQALLRLTTLPKRQWKTLLDCTKIACDGNNQQLCKDLATIAIENSNKRSTSYLKELTAFACAGNPHKRCQSIVRTEFVKLLKTNNLIEGNYAGFHLFNSVCGADTYKIVCKANIEDSYGCTKKLCMDLAELSAKKISSEIK